MVQTFLFEDQLQIRPTCPFILGILDNTSNANGRPRGRASGNAASVSGGQQKSSQDIWRLGSKKEHTRLFGQRKNDPNNSLGVEHWSCMHTWNLLEPVKGLWLVYPEWLMAYRLLGSFMLSCDSSRSCCPGTSTTKQAKPPRVAGNVTWSREQRA